MVLRIRDAAVDLEVSECFPLMPSYTGVPAICDDLQVTTSEPQLALPPVSEVDQRKFTESGRSLNLKKCCHLVRPPGLGPLGTVVTEMAPGPASALPSPLRPTAQNCLERPSAQSRFGQIS